MGFAEDKFWEYLRPNLPQLKNIKVDELLLYMSGHFSDATVERLEAYVRNKGNRSSVVDFYLELNRCDNWVSPFIYALGQCGHKELEKTFGEVYSKYLPKPKQSSPQSLPPSLNHNNQQPQNPQRISSLPEQRPPISPGPQPDPSPKPSPSSDQIQREQEMTRSSPSQQNHEYRSLPAFGTHNPPVAPRPAPSQNVSAPIHSDIKTLDDTFRNPVPETSPYLAVPSQGDDEALQEDASSISDNPHLGFDPLPSNSASPNLNVSWPEASNKPSSEDLSLTKESIRPSSEDLPPANVFIRPSSEDVSLGNGSIRPSSEDVSLGNVSIRPSSEELSSENVSIRPSSEELSLGNVSIRPSSEELSLGNVSIRPSSEELSLGNVSIRPSSEDGSLVKVTETRNSLSISDRGVDNQRGQNVRNKTQKLPEQVAAYIPINSGQDRGGNEQERQQSVIHKAANPPLQSVSATSTRTVREKVVAGSQRNGQSTCQAVEDVPESRPEYYCPPVNRGSAQEGPSRQWSSNQRVSSGSSCRPLDNNDEEEYLSKPGVLEYTLGCEDVTSADGPTSPMTSFPNLQISDYSDRSGSSNGGSQSSSSSTQDRVPPVSTPKNQSMPIEAKISPEENDDTYDMMSSPGLNRRLDHWVSQQPEENSFRSREVSHYRLQYNEEPEEDLMESNENALRSRTKKILDTSELNDQITKQKSSKKTEGRDHERMVLIVVTVTSVCLCLYLLWKNHQK